MTAVEYMRAEEARRRPFLVSVSPMASLFMATRDAVGARRSDTPEPWCEAIRAHLTRADHEAFAPLATSQVVFVPDALLPWNPAPMLPLKDALEQVVAVSDGQLARDIHATIASGPTGDWRSAEREPRRWVRRFVGALARAWTGFRPIWQQAQESLAREIERVNVAGARGSQLELLDGFLPNARVEGDEWRLHALEGGELRLPPTGLVVMPLVAGERGSMVGGSDGVMTDIGYPLPLAAERPPIPPASLDALLGVQRARILRALERPAKSGRLAEALRTVPSAVTHHVTALEAAGLVTRTRLGRYVVVRRTERGEALLGLYRRD
jgi:DNA-binding transcriptional ArsR family regulator